MIILLALGCGILFGAGLAISGMINPQKILAFLDVGGIPSGTWDPTFGVVFASALVPMFIAYAIQRRMARPALGVHFEIPTRRDLDTRLSLVPRSSVPAGGSQACAPARPSLCCRPQDRNSPHLSSSSLPCSPVSGCRPGSTALPFWSPSTHRPDACQQETHKEALMSDLPKSVRINEEGPREGFQFEKGPIPTARKIELIDACRETGLKHIQIVSFVNPKNVPGMADAEEVVQRYQAKPGRQLHRPVAQRQGPRARAWRPGSSTSRARSR